MFAYGLGGSLGLCGYGSGCKFGLVLSLVLGLDEFGFGSGFGFEFGRGSGSGSRRES